MSFVFSERQKFFSLPFSASARSIQQLFWVTGLAATSFLVAHQAYAIESKPASLTQTDKDARIATLERPMRGLSLQMHVGGGYWALNRKIPPNTTYPTLSGKSEMVGAGPSIDGVLGLDVLPFMAVQIAGGMTLGGARRTDYMHSLAASYGAVGLRFNIPLSHLRRGAVEKNPTNDRWFLNITPSFAYFTQNDEIDAPKSGAGVLLAAGLEYAAHVRHFSLGADLVVQAPLAPTRVFIGIMPHVRYTF